MRGGSRRYILVGLLLAMFMTAIEATIVATAMPTVIGALGGFALYSWVFAIYLLTQAATIPLYGKLADIYGRKPVLIVGTVLFLIGSALSGQARSMLQLIIFRALQGLGAGAVQPITQTIVGDLWGLEERAKIQGYLSGVWGISSVLGPTLGGLLVTYAGWPWVFYVNVPLGLIVIGLIGRFLHEEVERQAHRVDYLGSVLLFLTVSLLIVSIVQGGVGWGWGSPISLALGAAVLAGSCLFVLRERRAAEPVLPLALLGRRMIAVADLGTFLAGVLTLGTSSTIPTYVQGVLQQSPLVAGLALGTQSIGWPLASWLSGRLMLRFGFRNTALAGTLFNLAGALTYWTASPQSSPAFIALGSFIMGIGLGLTATTYLIAIQNSVSWEQRGVATGSNAFGRMLGSTLGVAILGGLLNGRLAAWLQAHGTAQLHALGSDAGNVLLNPAGQAQLPAGELLLLREGFDAAAHSLFLGLAIVSIAALVTAALLPRWLESPAPDHGAKVGGQAGDE